ncbi:hypothetical protein [Campylobacter troglodytis]|uniref:hypothetical protein n=1 Tax=Campylobacter troglodytis TaxID=654363 RepID=UPI0011589FB7|nr:hypothetical protein [Campylobacter troglodytis]TQR51246.1 hypothetical protein DMC01_12705 [Campylobacter troglodytis]
MDFIVYLCFFTHPTGCKPYEANPLRKAWGLYRENSTFARQRAFGVAYKLSRIFLDCLGLIKSSLAMMPHRHTERVLVSTNGKGCLKLRCGFFALLSRKVRNDKMV